MKNVRTWASIKRMQVGSRKKHLRRSLGPRMLVPLCHQLAVWCWRSHLHLSGFHQGVDYRILRELSLLIAKDSKVTYFGFFNIVWLQMAVVLKPYLSLCCQVGNNWIIKHVSFPLTLGLRSFSGACRTSQKSGIKQTKFFQRKPLFSSICIIWF